ncbi:MAG TPA: DUF1559 domain-containing protein [Gemmataceae bacterium]|nr:DUF1559 domain-containing protein [Gemmataceae bacterium]
MGSKRRRRRSAFTLTELLVVMAIIAVLVGMIVPAIQRIRESANQIKCKNNLHQIGIALHLYYNDRGTFPASADLRTGKNGDNFSILSQLLPYVDENNLSKAIDWNQSFDQQGRITEHRIPIYVCPSEPNDRPRVVGAVQQYPLNYAANLGTWFVYDPMNGQGGDGACYCNSWLRPSDFSDGLSTTLAFSEVKAFNAILRDSGKPNQPNAPVPATPEEVIAYGGTFEPNTGHTNWADGRVLQAGFTTVFRPNMPVRYTFQKRDYDIDWVSITEGMT